MFAPSDQMLLPLVIIDTASQFSRRPSQHAVDPTDEPVARRSAPLVGSVKVNIVRLIPGITRLPFGFSQR